ncbi:MAG: hypothetical protein LBQ37_02615 [Elusimicrobiota bacterium]|jgi:hypothetical protein|nr:hypothetical protein [Elusimicrobiota bacterium]
MKAKLIGINKPLGKEVLQITFEVAKSEAVSLAALNNKDCQLKIKKWSNRRSLTANAALWELIGEMSKKLGKDKNEIYLEMLDAYGVFTHIVVKKNAVEKFEREYRLCKELGEVNVNGKKGIQLQCYFGSSSYTVDEFRALLDGVVQEAAQLDIFLFSESEREEFLRRYGNE